MHPNKIVLTKEIDEDVGDQWHPAGVEIEGEIIGRYNRVSRQTADSLEKMLCEPRSLIWLAPTCRDCVHQDRDWCQHDVWNYCVECGHKAIPYVLEELDYRERPKGRPAPCPNCEKCGKFYSPKSHPHCSHCGFCQTTEEPT